MGYLDFSESRRFTQARSRAPQFMQNTASVATGWRHCGHVAVMFPTGAVSPDAGAAGAGENGGDGTGGAAYIGPGICIGYAGQAGIVAWTWWSPWESRSEVRRYTVRNRTYPMIARPGGRNVPPISAWESWAKALGPIYPEFLKLKRMEWNDYHRQVSPWEVERYLTLL